MLRDRWVDGWRYIISPPGVDSPRYNSTQRKYWVQSLAFPTIIIRQQGGPFFNADKLEHSCHHRRKC